MDHEVTFPLINGTRIRQFQGGKGEVAVFLHGGAGLSVWTPFFQKISEHYDLRVPEHPGFGLSDNPEWLNTIADLALFYMDYLDNIDAEKIHLIGNSFGGWIAAEVASRDCSRLKSLTLIGPSGLASSADATDIFRWSHEESMRNLFHNQAIAERILTAPVGPEQLATLVKNQTTVVRLGAATRLVNPDLVRWLHRIKVPAHIVWGEEDRICSVATASIWAENLPHVKVTIVPEAGHLPHAEKADITGPAVIRFLQNAN
ncbi:alpha/beta fold hydrolase [Brucella gallinifaecis]|uniref:Alpha/beta hydrolase n=1 Tax=Brucella gallinifaecis TaxID=215590 RepID=A0A502BL77_9HYPH|nr:alpha/beta hydrolase [Brucella gallinifaecis]TPF74401.1 alpha/beta hydrolase [Brucella gallinifaecis]